MRIGLIDADLMWRKRANGRRYGKQKADVYPNLALMKLSAYHKQKGNKYVHELQHALRLCGIKDDIVLL